MQPGLRPHCIDLGACTTGPEVSHRDFSGNEAVSQMYPTVTQIKHRGLEPSTARAAECAPHTSGPQPIHTLPVRHVCAPVLPHSGLHVAISGVTQWLTYILYTSPPSGHIPAQSHHCRPSYPECYSLAWAGKDIDQNKGTSQKRTLPDVSDFCMLAL